MPQPWSKPGACRLVCTENRKSRPFKPKQVANVCRYAKRAGSSEWEIIGAAFAGVGRAEWFCGLAKAAAQVKATLELAASLGAIFTFSRLTQFGILIARRILGIAIPLRVREKIVIWVTSIKALKEFIDSTPFFSIEAIAIRHLDEICLAAINLTKPEDLKDAQTKPEQLG